MIDFLILIFNKLVLVGRDDNNTFYHFYYHLALMEKLFYTTLSSPFQYEIPKIKGSRFITTLIPTLNKEQIEDELVQIRKKYFDATHNCYAWRVWTLANLDLFGNWEITSQQERANDDWEPSNTAWKPILTVLKGKEIYNILAVVTRYYWWTLLGVWWLIQAYTEWTSQAIEHAPLIKKEITKSILLQYSYEQVSTVQYLYNKYSTSVENEVYEGTVKQTVSVNLAYYEIFKKELIDKQINFEL